MGNYFTHISSFNCRFLLHVIPFVARHEIAMFYFYWWPMHVVFYCSSLAFRAAFVGVLILVIHWHVDWTFQERERVVAIVSIGPITSFYRMSLLYVRVQKVSIRPAWFWWWNENKLCALNEYRESLHRTELPPTASGFEPKSVAACCLVLSMLCIDGIA